MSWVQSPLTAFRAVVAQRAERSPRKRQVAGSMPARGSRLVRRPNGCVAQWQSRGFISLRLLVRVQPFTHTPFRDSSTGRTPGSEPGSWRFDSFSLSLSRSSTGRTPDFDSGGSWFEPTRLNTRRSFVICPLSFGSRRLPTGGSRRRGTGVDTHVAQPVERAAVNRVTGGSNPSVGAGGSRQQAVGRKG